MSPLLFAYLSLAPTQLHPASKEPLPTISINSELHPSCVLDFRILLSFRCLSSCLWWADRDSNPNGTSRPRGYSPVPSRIGVPPLSLGASRRPRSFNLPGKSRVLCQLSYECMSSLYLTNRREVNNWFVVFFLFVRLDRNKFLPAASQLHLRNQALKLVCVHVFGDCRMHFK